MANKIPPPVGIATNDPVFNRWLLELTSVLNNSGGLNLDDAAGLVALSLQVQQNTAAVAALQQQTKGLASAASFFTSRLQSGPVPPVLGAPGSAPAGAIFINFNGGAGTRIYVANAAGAWTATAA